MSNATQRETQEMALEVFVELHPGESCGDALQELFDLSAGTENPEKTANRFTPLFALSFDELLFDVNNMADEIESAMDSMSQQPASVSSTIQTIAHDKACGIVNRGLLGELPSDGNADEPGLYRLQAPLSPSDLLCRISQASWRLKRELLVSYPHAW